MPRNIEKGPVLHSLIPNDTVSHTETFLRIDFVELSLIPGDQGCDISAQSNLNDDLGWELELIVKVRQWMTSVLILPGNVSKFRIPFDFLQDHGHFSLRSNLGFVDVKNSHLWPQNMNVSSVHQRGIIDLLVNEQLDLSKCIASTGNTKLLRSSAIERCGFINGLESGQGWFNHSEWLPDGDMGCQLVPVQELRPIRSRVLLIGDSQMRTSFQAMMSIRCEDFLFQDYREQNGVSGWCVSGSAFKANETRKEWHKSFCGGSFDVFGDGCWDGGAVWKLNDSEVIVYADMHSVSDGRYAHYDFVFGNTSATPPNVYDVVVLGTHLHDVNHPLAEKFLQDPGKINRTLD